MQFAQITRDQLEAQCPPWKDRRLLEQVSGGQCVSENHGRVSEAAAMGDLPRRRRQAYMAKKDPNSRHLSGIGKMKQTDIDTVQCLCTTILILECAFMPDRRCLQVFLASEI